MARHGSFQNLIALETYQRFIATVRARQRALQDPAWELEGDGGIPGDGQQPGQAAGANADPSLPFRLIEDPPARAPKSESWIENWLSGKTSDPLM